MDDSHIFSFMYCLTYDDAKVVKGNYSYSYSGNMTFLPQCVCGNDDCDNYVCKGLVILKGNQIHVLSSVQINFRYEGGGWKFEYYINTDLPIQLIKWIKMVDIVFDKSIPRSKVDDMDFALMHLNIKTKMNWCNIAIKLSNDIETMSKLPGELWLHIYGFTLNPDEYAFYKWM